MHVRGRGKAGPYMTLVHFNSDVQDKKKKLRESNTRFSDSDFFINYCLSFPEHSFKGISNYYEIRKYIQMYRLITGVNDTGDK